jgi:hypothetical protein
MSGMPPQAPLLHVAIFIQGGYKPSDLKQKNPAWKYFFRHATVNTPYLEIVKEGDFASIQSFQLELWRGEGHDTTRNRVLLLAQVVEYLCYRNSRDKNEKVDFLLFGGQECTPDTKGFFSNYLKVPCLNTKNKIVTIPISKDSIIILYTHYNSLGKSNNVYLLLLLLLLFIYIVSVYYKKYIACVKKQHHNQHHHHYLYHVYQLYIQLLFILLLHLNYLCYNSVYTYMNIHKKYYLFCHFVHCLYFR